MLRIVISLLLLTSLGFPQNVEYSYNCDEIKPIEPELRLELLTMAEADQKTRSELDSGKMSVVDRENSARLGELLAVHDWLGIDLVGCDGANAAWLIAQHADQNLAVQKLALDRLTIAYENGQAEPYQFAYLTDRVRVNTGRKQIYGTQVRFVGDEAQPKPLEDPERVDELRREVGLTPLADYLDQMNSIEDEGN